MAPVQFGRCKLALEEAFARALWAGSAGCELSHAGLVTVFPEEYSLDADVYTTRLMGLFIVRNVLGGGWTLESWQVLSLPIVCLVGKEQVS